MEVSLDPEDYYEPNDYEIYDEKYADEIAEIANVEEPDVDFDVVSSTQNRKARLKNSDLNASNGLDSSAVHGEIKFPEFKALKRDCFDMDYNFSQKDALKYSGDEGSLSINNPKVKRMKLDQEHGEGFLLPDLKTEKGDESIRQLQSYYGLEEATLNEVSEKVYRKRVFSRPVLGIDSSTVTSTEGDRVFLKLLPEEDVPKIENSRWNSNSSDRGLNLLSVPFSQIKKEVERKRHNQIMKDLDAVSPDVNIKNSKQKDPGDAKTSELWVEKYTPRKYTELLSDDGTNRLLLKWLKLWDDVVFGHDKNYQNKQKGKDQFIDKKIKDDKFSKDAKNKFQKKYYDPEDDLIKDSKGRPKKKIALLCGNPGLGKTTLAHVISHHAGYNVVEMNASDDRSPEVFFNKIEMSTQMKAVIGQSKRPNCLIIDEIDGAPIQAINILLNLVKVTETAGTKLKKKRKKKEFLLNRPIICICNDQFVPALRQLRQVAFTLKFLPTLASRLASRLLNISLNEGIKIGMTSLLLLAEKAENDIRSCLNTLQFIQQRKKDFKPEDLKNLEVGQKDMKKGVRVILTEVFQLPRANKHILSQNCSKGSQPTSILSSRFHYILHLISAMSEFEKIMQGLFDHYLEMKIKDPYLESVNLANEWLGFNDIIQQKIMHDQDYVMWKYLSILPVSFHMYFARTTPGKIQYSNIAYENHLKVTHNEQTLQMMKSGMNPQLRRNCSSNITILDIVPYLFLITLPNLRPVNTKLYSESEKQIFLSLINTMISYNLTYRQERNAEGHYTYVLEPNIEELITFTGLSQHRHLPYATKQLIAREVEMEKMRQAENVTQRANVDIDSQVVNSVSKTSVNIPKSHQLSTRRIGKTADRTQLDFFGRIVEPSTAKVNKSKKKEDEKVSSILNSITTFRFNEGYTNAVRRTVKIHEFL